MILIHPGKYDEEISLDQKVTIIGTGNIYSHVYVSSEICFIV